MCVEARILLIVGCVIAILLFVTVHGIYKEMESERICLENKGKFVRASDGPICIKKDAIVK